MLHNLGRLQAPRLDRCQDPPRNGLLPPKPTEADGRSHDVPLTGTRSQPQPELVANTRQGRGAPLQGTAGAWLASPQPTPIKLAGGLCPACHEILSRCHRLCNISTTRLAITCPGLMSVASSVLACPWQQNRRLIFHGESRSESKELASAEGRLESREGCREPEEFGNRWPRRGRSWMQRAGGSAHVAGSAIPGLHSPCTSWPRHRVPWHRNQCTATAKAHPGPTSPTLSAHGAITLCPLLPPLIPTSPAQS